MSCHQTMVFTLGVANLKMIVRQSDPGVAGIVAVVLRDLLRLGL